MNYAAELKRIGTLTQAVASAARRLEWNLGRTVPDRIKQAARARVERLKESEDFRRAGAQRHLAVEAEIAGEMTTHAQLAGSASRNAAEAVLVELDTTYRPFVAARRADTSLSFEGVPALDATGQIMLAMLETQTRPIVEKMTPEELEAGITKALLDQNWPGLVTTRLVEQRFAHNTGLTTSMEQLPAVKRVREIIDALQDLRVPIEHLGDVEPTIEYARRQISMAAAAGIRSVNTSMAANANYKAAFESEHAEYKAAIEQQAEHHEQGGDE
jgi:hypothetical protein